jgi:uncharacterized protein involved in exopolysaccharide biosynthesis
VSIVPRVGGVRIVTKTREAQLSFLSNRAIIDLVNEFNQERRRVQAAAEREFSEERLAEARARLRAAEDSLERFMERNREIVNSPRLSFAKDRLVRDVGRRQALYETLEQSVEQARLDEARNTPTITVLDPPVIPLRPDSRMLVFRLLIGLVIGGVFGALGGIVRDRVSDARLTGLKGFPSLTGAVSRFKSQPWSHD